MQGWQLAEIDAPMAINSLALLSMVYLLFEWTISGGKCRRLTMAGGLMLLGELFLIGLVHRTPLTVPAPNLADQRFWLLSVVWHHFFSGAFFLILLSQVVSKICVVCL